MKKYAVLHEPGDIVTLAGTEFVVLDVEHRGTLPDSLFILAKNTVGSSNFGRFNDYEDSDLRMAVEEWLKGMEKKGLDLDRIIPREIDLTTLDGCTLYGKLDVKAAPLTLDEARRYASRIPNADSWYWLATGWSGPLKGDKGNALYVNSSGDWLSGYCSNSRGIRPALKIPSDLLLDSADKPDLSEVPTDTLLEEIRRRVVDKA